MRAAGPLGLALLLAPAAIGLQGAPDAEWFTSHGGSRAESHGHYVLACSDGGFLQVGETGFVGSDARLLVVKTDSGGGLLWKKEFGSGNKNMGNSALEVDDGYVICGMLSRNSALLKLDKDTGATLLQRTHDIGGADAFEHVAPTANGFLAVGYRQAADANSTFFVYGQGSMSFLDGNGDLLSTISVNAHLSQAYRVQPSGGDFIVAGGTDDALEYGVLKVSPTGAILWSRTFGGSEEDHCFGMDLGADGSIFLAGHTLSGTANWDTYTMKLDGTGNQLWERKRGNPRGFNPNFIHDETWGVRATWDGGCVIAAGTGDEYSYSACSNGACSDQWEAYVVKYDANGALDWEETYSSTNGNDWAAEDIDLTSDGGAIVAVDNSQFGFLKLGPLLDLGDVSETYCDAASNSASAAGGSIAIAGNPAIAANDVVLSASGLPAGQWSFFLMSRTQASVPGFGGSQGVLCLGPPQVRFSRAGTGEIAQTTAQGTRTLALDLADLPQGQVFLPGESWNFQLWFRDQNPGATSNTTNGVRATFR